MKLYELHILYVPFGTVDHSDAITGCYHRIGCRTVYLSGSACSNDGDPGEYGINVARLFIECIYAIAGNIGREAGNIVPQMMLRNQVYPKKMLVNRDIWQLCDLGQQCPLHFPAREIFVVQNPVFRMSSFSAQIILFAPVFVKTGTPVNDFLHTRWPLFNYDTNDLLITQTIASVECICNVFFV